MLTFWQKQQKSTSDWVHQPRSSSEHEELSPLMDEEGTNERRYYRSAEFQQALLEKQIEENLTTPTDEQSKRRQMSFTRYRRGSVASKTSTGHPLFDFEEEQARQAAGIELPPPAYNTIQPPRYVEENKPVEPTKKSHKHHRPRVHLAGIGPLINFAGRK